MESLTEDVKKKEKVESSATELMYQFAVMPRDDQSEIVQAIFKSKPNFKKYPKWWGCLFKMCRDNIQMSDSKMDVSEIQKRFASDINYTKGLDDIFAIQAKGEQNAQAGIKKGYFVIIQKAPVKNGDFVAVYNNTFDWCNYGVYSNFFGFVSLEHANKQCVIIGSAEITVLGKIIGYCTGAKSKKLYPLREVR